MKKLQLAKETAIRTLAAAELDEISGGLLSPLPSPFGGALDPFMPGFPGVILPELPNPHGWQECW